MNFTYNGYKFEGRQTEAHNIVWLEGNPDDSESMPRSFTFEEVADSFIVNREMSDHLKKRFIIEEIEGELAVVLLKDGYNIIEKTIYDPELAATILAAITEAQR